MALNDTLANVLNLILNTERVGKPICTVHPISKITLRTLNIMKDHHFIGDIVPKEDGKGGYIEVNLIGGINNCGVIKPKFSVTLSEFDKFEKRFLPAKNFGLLIVSTSQGVMTQMDAKEKGIGGRLIAFVY